jgi:hypothetical protein
LVRGRWPFLDNFANDVKVCRFLLPITVVRIVSDAEGLPATPCKDRHGKSPPALPRGDLMRQAQQRRHSWRRTLYGLGLCATLGGTGCQVDVGGQTLPSAHYQQDDIQYFPAGPEFKLSKEAAAQKAYSENPTTEER